jgi:ribosomal protein S27AE
MEGQQSASSSSSPNSSNEVVQPGDVSGSGGEVPPAAAAASAQNQTSVYRDATENPVWRDVTSRNMMGEYDPQNTDPAYHNSWMACQRLVNMHRPEALEAANNFIPTNPRLAALLENQRIENARERYEEQQQLQQGSTSRRQREWSSAPSFPQDQDDQGMDVDEDEEGVGASSTTTSSSSPPTSSSIAYQQQVAEYERLHQAHMLQQRQRTDANSSPKSDSSGSSRSSKYKNVDSADQNYYVALPQATRTLTTPCVCTRCNSALFTAALAKRFYCQSCGCITSLPRMDAEACYEEKMQDAADFDVSDQNMSW